MRASFASRIAFIGTIIAGTAFGSTPPTIINRNVGEDFEAGVFTFSDVVEECYIITPLKNTIRFKPTDESNEKYQLLEDIDLARCHAKVLDLDLNDNGLWTIHSVSNEGFRRSQSFQVTVNATEGSESESESASSEHDTSNPDVTVIYLDELRFDTALNSLHRIEIPYRDFIRTESCYVITPDNDQVNLENQNITGVEVVSDPNIACGIVLSVKEEMLGQWILVSKEMRFSTEPYERRLPFIITVTEVVNAIPREITVDETNDFYVRFENPVSNPEICKLMRPDGTEQTQFETDPRYVDTCGYIVRNVNQLDSGTWHIVHSDRITYNAFFQVTVQTNGAQSQNRIDFIWTRDQPVQEIFGSDDAIYCKVTDPKSFVVFEGFGRCNVTLPRATSDHQGIWRMFVGIRGRVLTEESIFTVQVVDGAPKAIVATQVSANNPTVSLTCSVSCPYPIRACKFRSPSGRILMANPGVGEDQYTFHGQGSSYESGVHTHDCGIQITNPPNRDLGFWRCAIETSNETYYGFLMAKWAWGWRDPEVVAAVVTEPTLSADRTLVQSVAGDSVLMSCSVQSPIRYCYFRTSNGTIYNVGPGGSSTDLGDYAGAGLDAGECNIRFRSLNEADSGRWSCHVGFNDLDMQEQRENFYVTIKDIMTVTQTEVAVKAVVEGRQLDYCRFVRIDGFGFASDAVPAPYTVDLALNNGECTLWTFNPTMMDRHPWTVAARITGHSSEITRQSNSTLGLPSRPPFPPAPEGPYRLSVFWYILMVSGLVLIVTGALVGSEKGRRWTQARATSIRTSFRQQFAKKAVNDDASDKTAANAA